MTTDAFDFDAWLESVRGETVRVTTPPDGQLGGQASKLYASPVAHERHQSYCADCDEFVLRTTPDGGHVGRCPLCGREPGLLELGTTPDGVTEV